MLLASPFQFKFEKVTSLALKYLKGTKITPIKLTYHNYHDVTVKNGLARNIYPVILLSLYIPLSVSLCLLVKILCTRLGKSPQIEID